MEDEEWTEILERIDKKGGVGSYVGLLERSLKTGQQNLSRIQADLAALQDPEKIYSLWADRTRGVMGDSYLLIGPNRDIREVTPAALKIMDMTSHGIVGKDYRHVVEENGFPADAKINPGEGLTIIMLDNERVVQLGPYIQFGSAVPGVNRYYGEIVRVSKGPEVTMGQRILRLTGIVGRQEESIEVNLAKAKKKRKKENASNPK